jgi:hypothetical protein
LSARASTEVSLMMSAEKLGLSSASAPAEVPNVSTDRLIADFLARGGGIKKCRPETFNRWAQQHRRVWGVRGTKGRSK